jgi:hypothetical protein
MPGQEEIFEALKVWCTFLVAPGTALGQASLAIAGPTTGGACSVQGAEFKRQVQSTNVTVSGPSSANFQKHFKKTTVSAKVEEETVFQPNTKVLQLQVTHGGNGIAYWYPYLDRGQSGGTFNGVGECTIPATASRGTVALTGAMNGCSLRIFEDQLGSLHFYHDNNGENLDEGTLTARGYEHLLSINSANTPTKMRGTANRNFVYWDPGFDAPMRAACYLMSLKTGPNEWEIWRSMVLHQFRNEQRSTFFSSKTVNVFSYCGAQRYNTHLLTLTILPRRSRSGSVSELPGVPPPVRGRSGSF